MTRDERRAHYAKVMAEAHHVYCHTKDWDGLTDYEFKEFAVAAMIAALDSLHGIAFVDPIEATEEMLLSVSDFNGISRAVSGLLWRTMAARGNLTNQPVAIQRRFPPLNVPTSWKP